MKKYEVMIHYSGKVMAEVEAENEEQARKMAEQAFDNVSDADLIASIEDIHVCDCWEV